MTKYDFSVDAVNNPEGRELKSYKLISSNPKVPENDLVYKESANFVKKALYGNGYYEASEGAKAELIIGLEYGIGEAQTRLERDMEPVYAVVHGRNEVIRIRDTGSNGKVSYRTAIVRNPRRHEIVDYRTSYIPTTFYKKYLTLKAWVNDDKFTANPEQAWTVDVENKDGSDDLRKYMPLMTAAAMTYMGENTQKKIILSIKESDEIVVFVKNKLIPAENPESE